MKRPKLTYFLFLFCFAFLACGGVGKKTSLLPPSVVLLPGDVVFRRGVSVESEAVMLADRQGRYSHCGIVVDSCGQIRIVHAVPSEPSDPQAAVKCDPPERFFCSDRTAAGAVCRMKGETSSSQPGNTAALAASAALNAFFRQVPFDTAFDDTDTTRFYCSELVQYAYATAGTDLAGPQRSSYSLFFKHFSHVILPSQIFLSPHLTPISVF